MDAFNEFQLQILKQDTLIRKIPVTDYPVILEKVAGHCDNVIKKYASLSHSDTCFEWLEKQGIKIVFQKKCPQKGRLLFGEYQVKERVIYLFEETINEYSFAFTDNPLKFTLLHEIYHVIEAKEQFDYHPYYRIPLLRIGPFKLNSGIMTFSELSANYFASQIQNNWRN